MDLTFVLLFCLALCWSAGVAVASILFRRARDKPIFPTAPESATYVERWGSGRNLTTFIGKFGGAETCLIIAITPDRLIVTPRFPFTLGFLPEIYGLEFDVPLKDITQVTRKRILWRSAVVISTKDGRRLEIVPRRIDEFMAAVGRF